jgi:hypothetical protein
MLRPTFAGLRRRRLVRPIMRTSLQMAAGDVVAGLSVSLLFLVLTLTGQSGESSALYLALIASSLLMNAFAYLLRIVQPQASLALNHGGGMEMRNQVVRWLRWLAYGGGLYLLTVLLLALLFFAGAAPGVVEVGVLLLFLACFPVFFGMSSVNYVLENASAIELRVTARAGLVSLVVVAALAFFTLPWLGALGAIAVLAAGDVVHAAIALCWLQRAGHTCPIGRRSPI